MVIRVSRTGHVIHDLAIFCDRVERNDTVCKLYRAGYIIALIYPDDAIKIDMDGEVDDEVEDTLLDPFKAVVGEDYKVLQNSELSPDIFKLVE